MDTPQAQSILTLLLRDAVHDLGNWLESQRALGADRLSPDADKTWGNPLAAVPSAQAAPVPAASIPAPAAAIPAPNPVMPTAPAAARPSGPRQTDRSSGSMASFMALRDAQPVRRLETPVEKQMALDILNARCRACRQCPLGSKRRGVLCGYGPSDATLMFIAAGANPGEFDTGRIMTGEAAELFDKIVQAMATLTPAAAPERIYMTNVIKCACAPARNQINDCATQCLAYVREEVQIVAPKVIVVWGQMAYRTLFGSDALISQARGSVLFFEGIRTIATHHPMELVKQPNLKRRVWDDLKMAASFL